MAVPPESEPSRACVRLRARASESLRLSASGEQTVCRIAGDLDAAGAIVAPSCHPHADPRSQATASARAPSRMALREMVRDSSGQQGLFPLRPGHPGRGHARSCARAGWWHWPRRRGAWVAGGGTGAGRHRRGTRCGRGRGLSCRERGRGVAASICNTIETRARAAPHRAHSPVTQPPPAISDPPPASPAVRSPGTALLYPGSGLLLAHEYSRARVACAKIPNPDQYFPGGLSE